MAANSDSIYATMPDWCALSGMRPAKTYDELSRGNLRAKKVGKRLLIDVQHGLAWLRTLPEPVINLRRAPRAVASVTTKTRRRRITSGARINLTGAP